jgi:putative oxidoreductase
MQIRVHTSPALQAWGISVLRVIVGMVFLVHGLQKTFVTGMTGVADFMGQIGMPFPMTAAVLASAVEVLCGLALIAGFLTRWAAIPLAIEMFVAGALVHWHAGFFLPNGYEFALTLLAACAALSLLGSGVYALDNVLPVEGSPVTGPTRAGSTKAA